LVALSACPSGDCSASHSDDTAKCYPLKVEIHRRTRERWPAGCHHRRTNILARMEPGKGRLRLRCGSLELSNGPLRMAAVLYLLRASAAPQQADHPLCYINRLFSASCLPRGGYSQALPAPGAPVLFGDPKSNAHSSPWPA
jgi:hypothetical protein